MSGVWIIGAFHLIFVEIFISLEIPGGRKNSLPLKNQFFLSAFCSKVYYVDVTQSINSNKPVALIMKIMKIKTKVKMRSLESNCFELNWLNYWILELKLGNEDPVIPFTSLKRNLIRMWERFFLSPQARTDPNVVNSSKQPAAGP